MAIQSGSIWPGVVFHLANNSFSILCGKFVPKWTEQYPQFDSLVQTTEIGFVYWWPFTAICIAGIATLLYWFHSLPYLPTVEERLRDTLQHQSSHSAETQSEAQVVS